MSRLQKVLISLPAVILAGGLVTLVWASGGRDEVRKHRGPAVLASAGEISISNSLGGEAVLRAHQLVPGERRTGTVTVGNPNRQPMTMSLATRLTAAGTLADALELNVRRAAGGNLYAGPLSGMPRLPLGELAPQERRRYEFTVGLPPDSGNALQGGRAAADLIWAARAAGPPPKCRLRAMRARFFVFRGRNRIRLVSRYKAAVPARVAVDFFERRRNGEPGRLIGTLRTRFARRPHSWGLNRVAVRRGRAEMRRFRRSRRGYVAQIRVSGAPGWCRQYLNLDLVQLKRFYGQYVWFQRGSFRTR